VLEAKYELKINIKEPLDKKITYFSLLKEYDKNLLLISEYYQRCQY